MLAEVIAGGHRAGGDRTGGDRAGGVRTGGDRAAGGDRRVAVGIDARTPWLRRHCAVGRVCSAQGHLRSATPAGLRPGRTRGTLLRRYTETRRRHPLAPQGVVADGIAAETALTEPLRAVSDLVVDTSGLPVGQLRRMIERHFGSEAGQPGLAVSLMSFAYPKGLPREADLVFDARFLRNPHYDPILRPRTGMDPEVGAYVEADPDFSEFFFTDRRTGRP